MTENSLSQRDGLAVQNDILQEVMRALAHPADDPWRALLAQIRFDSAEEWERRNIFLTAYTVARCITVFEAERLTTQGHTDQPVPLRYRRLETDFLAAVKSDRYAAASGLWLEHTTADQLTASGAIQVEALSIFINRLSDLARDPLETTMMLTILPPLLPAPFGASLD